MRRKKSKWGEFLMRGMRKTDGKVWLMKARVRKKGDPSEG